VHKILGPGNQYVTAAKMLLQNSEAMVAIDMPAGPSEVLVGCRSLVMAKALYGIRTEARMPLSSSQHSLWWFSETCGPVLAIYGSRKLRAGVGRSASRA
jgi:hypothetical protein